MRIQKIISGGQTGADRAGLDWAIKNGIPHGGYCPKGRRSEDGPIDAKYQLQETASKEYPPRTELNVKNSDGTVIFSKTLSLGRGSALTSKLADRHGKPCLVLLFGEVEPEGERLYIFVEQYDIKVLNVAGSRESTSPGIHNFVEKVLDEAFKYDKQQQSSSA